MPLVHIKPFSALPSRRWTGGVTQEIAISPENSRFENRTFLVRVSTATVSVSGPFTPFPGFQRVLMLLHGDGMELIVHDRHIVLSEPYQQVAFSGDVHTTCRLLGGEVRDLNVIFRSPAEASIQCLRGVVTTTLSAPPPTLSDCACARTDLLFSLSGAFSVGVQGRTQAVKAQEVCIMQEDAAGSSSEIIDLSAPVPSDIVWITIVVPTTGTSGRR